MAEPRLRKDQAAMLAPLSNMFGLVLEHFDAWPHERARAWSVWWSFIEDRNALAVAVKTARDLSQSSKNNS